MKRSHLFGALVALILAVSVAIAAVVPAIAHNKPEDPPAPGTLKAYGYSAEVLLQLPSPATPSHPYNMRLLVQHYDQRSALGEEDAIGIYIWSTAYPGGSRFVWIGAIRDSQAGIDFNKLIYTGVVGAENQMKVNDEELEINKKDDVLTVNLTKAVTFTVGDPWPQHWKDLNFTFPPMTLEFRGFDEVYKDVGPTTLILPPYSGVGWASQITAWRQPAWVEVSIPAWYRTINSYIVGQLNTKVVMTWTPPPAP